MQANLATFGTRFKAAVVDAVVVVMLTGPPILATALLFPRHVAIPFFTATKTEVLDQKESSRRLWRRPEMMKRNRTPVVM